MGKKPHRFRPGTVALREIRRYQKSNCSSESFHSSDWSEKLPRISKPISDSRALLSWLFKKPLKLTWSASSKTPTCAPSTPRGSPLCQKISNWLDESEENELKKLTI